MPVETASVEAGVRRYILQNLLFSDNDAELANDTSLLGAGIVDSTSVLEIILYLEEAFGVQVKPSEMLPENFDSVDNIVRFVGRLRDGA